MDIVNELPALNFKDYLWIVYSAYIFIVVVSSAVLLYHWNKNALARNIKSGLIKTTYLTVLIFLILVATAFYLKI